MGFGKGRTRVPKCSVSPFRREVGPDDCRSSLWVSRGSSPDPRTLTRNVRMDISGKRGLSAQVSVTRLFVALVVGQNWEHATRWAF